MLATHYTSMNHDTKSESTHVENEHEIKQKQDGIQFSLLNQDILPHCFLILSNHRPCLNWKEAIADFTFDLGRGLLGEGEGVGCDDQSGQFTEDQSEHGHERPFALGLVQEVSWTVTSHRRLTWGLATWWSSSSSIISPSPGSIFSKPTWRCWKSLWWSPGTVCSSGWAEPEPGRPLAAYKDNQSIKSINPFLFI